MYIYSNEIECFINTQDLIRHKDLRKALSRFTYTYRIMCQGSGCKCFSIWTSILVSLQLADRWDLWNYECRFLDDSDAVVQERMKVLTRTMAERLEALSTTLLPSGNLAVGLVLQLARACERDI